MSALLLFDLDNTLVDRTAAFRGWAVEFAARHGLDDVEWLHEAEGDGFVPRTEFFAAVRVRFGLRDDVDTLVEQYRGRMPELVGPRRDVLDGLAVLRSEGHRLGVVTNGEPGLQTAVLRAAGLTDAVDGWAISGYGDREVYNDLYGSASTRCTRVVVGYPHAREMHTRQR